MARLSLANSCLAAVHVQVDGYVVASARCARIGGHGLPAVELSRTLTWPAPTLALPAHAGRYRPAREAGARWAVSRRCRAGPAGGLGSHVHWDRRSSPLAQALMSIQAIKGIEIGPAWANEIMPGTQVHDALFLEEGQVTRHANRAGGVEGGITNGEPLVMRAAMKPIPTTVTPQQTVDLATGQPAQTEYQRSDVCAVPAAAVVAETRWHGAGRCAAGTLRGRHLCQIVTRVRDGSRS